jgi:DNA-binding transcriptional regulator YhcF (GntR family)
MADTSLPPLVKKTVQRLTAMLAKGDFTEHGKPLPSRRELALQLGVSHFTVGRAMEVLRMQGIIESAEGSYTFLNTVPEPVPDEPHDAKSCEVSFWTNSCGSEDIRYLRLGIVRHRFQTEFMDRHPGVVLKEKRSNLPYEKYTAQMLDGMVRSGELCVGNLPQTYLPFLLNAKVLAPFPEAIVEDYLAKCDPLFLHRVKQSEQTVYLPFSVSFSNLCCNREAFLRAGLDPDLEFRDWDHFATICHQLKEQAGGKEPFCIAGNATLVQWLMHLVYQATDDLGESAVLPKIDWQSPGARRAVDYLLSMVYDWKLVKILGDNQSLATSDLFSGNLPIMIGGVDGLPLLAELGMASLFTLKALPGGPTGVPLSMLNSSGWFLNAQASEAVWDAAARYLIDWEEWSHFGEGGAELRKLGVSSNLYSVFSDPSKDQFTAHHQWPDSWRETFASLREMARWEAPSSDLLKTILGPALADLLNRPERPQPETILNTLTILQHQAGVDDHPDS